MKTVRILGAGFSGLTLAYELVKRGVPVEIFDKGTPGGLLQTSHLPSGLAEAAANGFLSCAEMEDLAQELNLNLLRPLGRAKRRFILRNGELRRWPLSLQASRTLISGFGKRWLRSDSFLPRPLETIEQFALRNFDREVLDYLITPALQGIYGADAGSLSAILIMNSLSGKGDVPRPRPGRVRGLVTFENGMQSLIEALIANLINRGVKIQTRKVQSRAEIEGQDGHVVAALPWAETAQVLGFDSSSVKMKGLISAVLFLPVEDGLPQGFGCLFPMQEDRSALGVIFNSEVFPGRARAGLRSESWILDFDRWSGITEGEVIANLVNERRELFGAKRSPVEARIHFWPKALPHYGLELEQFLADKKDVLALHAHGNFLGGIGLSKIYCRSRILAERILEHLR